MTIELNAQNIILAASTLGALFAIAKYGDKFIDWLKSPGRYQAKLTALEQKHDTDVQETNAELQLLTYGILACLKGLKEQGCNGPVTEAIAKIEKHLNEKAHH